MCGTQFGPVICRSDPGQYRQGWGHLGAELRDINFLSTIERSAGRQNSRRLNAKCHTNRWSVRVSINEAHAPLHACERIG
jgi:hypothetical protein